MNKLTDKEKKTIKTFGRYGANLVAIKRAGKVASKEICPIIDARGIK